MSDAPNIEKQDSNKDLLISELDQFDVNVLKLALAQARYYTLFGVDVTEKWDTATEQAHVLSNAYVKGFHDGAAHMHYDSAIKGMMTWGQKYFGNDKAAYDKWVHDVISDFE